MLRSSLLAIGVRQRFQHLLRIAYNPVLRGYKERAGKSIRPGACVVLNGSPHRVASIIQGKKGKGGGFVKATLKSLDSGQVFDKTFLSDEVVEHAELEWESVQYSWEDANEFVFMHTTTFEEIRLSKSEVVKSKFMKEGLVVKMQKFQGRVIGVQLPTILELSVVSLNGTGKATLESGAQLSVPDFIKEGTVVRVNTEEETYVDRVS
jgi:elongation factor P